MAVINLYGWMVMKLGKRMWYKGFPYSYTSRILGSVLSTYKVPYLPTSAMPQIFALIYCDMLKEKNITDVTQMKSTSLLAFLVYNH